MHNTHWIWPFLHFNMFSIIKCTLCRIISVCCLPQIANRSVSAKQIHTKYAIPHCNITLPTNSTGKINTALYAELFMYFRMYFIIANRTFYSHDNTHGRRIPGETMATYILKGKIDTVGSFGNPSPAVYNTILPGYRIKTKLHFVLHTSNVSDTSRSFAVPG